MDGDKLAHGELEGLVMDVLWDADSPLVAGWCVTVWSPRGRWRTRRC